MAEVDAVIVVGLPATLRTNKPTPAISRRQGRDRSGFAHHGVPVVGPYVSFRLRAL